MKNQTESFSLNEKNKNLQEELQNELDSRQERILSLSQDVDNLFK